MRVKRAGEYINLKARLIPAPATEPEQQLFAFNRKLETMEEELKSLPATDPNRNKLEPKLVIMRDFIRNVTQQAPSDVRLRVFYGFEVQALSGQLMNYFAVSNGLLVTSVTSGNKGARCGLEAGDVILQVGDKQVTGLPVLMSALDGAAGDPIEIVISRRREQMKLTFHP
jgi:membrane-associated protease RseP (regulator of RpoE activity)